MIGMINRICPELLRYSPKINKRSFTKEIRMLHLGIVGIGQ